MTNNATQHMESYARKEDRLSIAIDPLTRHLIVEAFIQVHGAQYPNGIITLKNKEQTESLIAMLQRALEKM